MTFARVDPTGVLRFDREAIEAYIRANQPRVRCPASPGRDPAAFAAAFVDVPVRALDWPLVAALARDVERRLGKALEAAHGFVLRKGEPELPAHAQVLLGVVEGKVTVRRLQPDQHPDQGPDRRDDPGASIAQHVRVPAAVVRVLEAGVPLRGVRLSEGFVRLEGGHYEVEQKFVLSPRVHLGPADDPAGFHGYTLETHPRATPGWEAWADRVAAALPGAPAGARSPADVEVDDDEDEEDPS
jgi:hypothetical protein